MNFIVVCGLFMTLFAFGGVLSRAQTAQTPKAPASGDNVQPPTDNGPQAHPSSLACKPTHSGHVTVKVHVSETGEPLKESVVTSSGDPCLDQNAMEAVHSYHFKPARKGNIAVAVDLVIEINMAVTGSDSATHNSVPAKKDN